MLQSNKINRLPIGTIISPVTGDKIYIKTCQVWNDFMVEQRKQQYCIDLFASLDKEYAEKTIFPKRGNMINAYKLTPFNNIKVVLMGQEPFINDGEAHGLSFSSVSNFIPATTKNIYQEIHADYYNNANITGMSVFKHGNLTQWAEQGVFLLNTILTVEKGKSGSHKAIGWKEFICNTIKLINEKAPLPVVFILWGNAAKAFAPLITDNRHLVLEAAHPLQENFKKDVGFYGCKHFTQANKFLLNSRKHLATNPKDYLTVNWGIF